MTRDKYITVDELSEYLRVHKITIYRMLKQGKLPAFRIGSDWRFSLETIMGSAPTQPSTRPASTVRSARPPRARPRSVTGPATSRIRPTRSRRSARWRWTSARAPTW